MPADMHGRIFSHLAAMCAGGMRLERTKAECRCDNAEQFAAYIVCGTACCMAVYYVSNLG